MEVFIFIVWILGTLFVAYITYISGEEAERQRQSSKEWDKIMKEDELRSLKWEISAKMYDELREITERLDALEMRKKK